MDINQYIESGALELYVLGKLSPEDSRTVEQLADVHPEVAAEIDRIEGVLEELAFRTAGEVDPDVLKATLSQIRSTRLRSVPSPSPVPAAKAGLPSWLGWGLAVLGLALAIWFWLAQRTAENELQDTRRELEQLRNDCQSLSAEQEETSAILASLTAPATQNIVLAGTDNAPESKALVFYNTNGETIFFAASNLPAPPAGKQYQLWGIDGEGPKSLGVLNRELSNGTVLPIDYLPGVAAFAITLEDLGGKPEPDLSQLQVIGEVSQG